MKKYYSYRSKPNFYYSVKEFDFTSKDFYYDHFLLQEFFNADLKTKEEIDKFYINNYGKRAFEYLNDKYLKWANGKYHLTDMMKNRIISLMPKFLSEKAKYNIGIYEYINAIKRNINNYNWKQKQVYNKATTSDNIEQIIKIYDSECERINSINNSYFRFNVLSGYEQKEVLEISKYILNLKLKNTFIQIERDFSVFLPYIKKIINYSFSAHYYIEPFNLSINLNTFSNNIKFPNIKFDRFEQNGRYSEIANKYIASELVVIHSTNNKRVVNSFLNSHDINIFLEHYEKLTAEKSYSKMNSVFQGEAGVLKISIDIKPIKLLRISVLLAFLKSISYIAIFFIGLFLLVYFKLFTLLIFAILIFGIALISSIKSEVSRFTNLTKELIKLKQNGKQPTC